MLSTESLRDQLDRYAQSAITSAVFEEWLASESWDMARWVPRGLQRVVEAIQAALIDYSAGNISQEQLHDVLMERRAQLHRAAEVTKALDESRAKLLAAMDTSQSKEGIAGTESVLTDTEAVILQSSVA